MKTPIPDDVRQRFEEWARDTRLFDIDYTRFEWTEGGSVFGYYSILGWGGANKDLTSVWETWSAGFQAASQPAPGEAATLSARVDTVLARFKRPDLWPHLSDFADAMEGLAEAHDAFVSSQPMPAPGEDGELVTAADKIRSLIRDVRTECPPSTVRDGIRIDDIDAMKAALVRFDLARGGR